MKTLLQEAGFNKIWKFEFGHSNYQPFTELDNRPENSFYIEAKK